MTAARTKIGATRAFLRAASGGFLILVGAVALSPAAGAQGSGARGIVHAKSPVGNYIEHSSDGGHALFLIHSDHTFTTDLKESGTWVSLGSHIAFRVDTAATPYVECVYFGTFSKNGINTAAKPGPAICPTGKITWYATPDTTSATTGSPAGRVGDAGGPAPRSHRSPVGQYEGFLPGDTSPLFFAANGTVGFDDADGYWVTSGTSIAFSLVTNSTDRPLPS